MPYPRYKCLVMRVTSNENKIVSQSEFSFLVMGLRKSSWSKLPFYQTRTGTRFLFYMMNSLKTEGNELAPTTVVDFKSLGPVNHQKSDGYSQYIHSFRNVWDTTNY